MFQYHPGLHERIQIAPIEEDPPSFLRVWDSLGLHEVAKTRHGAVKVRRCVLQTAPAPIVPESMTALGVSRRVGGWAAINILAYDMGVESVAFILPVQK